MTNREFYTAIAANETLTEDIRNHATEQIAKLDATAEKRKGKVSKADQEKRLANVKLANIVATEILTTEPKTATDIAAVLTEMLGETVKVQKASYLAREAVKMGLAAEIEVKIPKKGSQKGYTNLVSETLDEE